MCDCRITNLNTVGIIITLGESVHRDYVNHAGVYGSGFTIEVW